MDQEKKQQDIENKASQIEPQPEEKKEENKENSPEEEVKQEIELTEQKKSVVVKAGPPLQKPG
jgi:hypothetical protein